MPRRPRKKSSTNMYHIVIKGIDKQIIFEEKKDYKKYLEILSLYKEECNFKLFAYCLMSDHVHLLIQISEISLETIFRKINTHYAVWFNMKYQRTGRIQDILTHGPASMNTNPTLITWLTLILYTVYLNLIFY